VICGSMDWPVLRQTPYGVASAVGTAEISSREERSKTTMSRVEFFGDN
jgi:hypothetical protein